jgi:hypothetical protein
MFYSCASISVFDQHAYTQTTSIKVDALNVMTLATEDYASYTQKVQDLEVSLQKVYEYEKNRPKNEFSIKLWNLLLNKEGHLLGGFIERWKKEGKLNAAFILNSKEQVSEAFDIIAGLESHKIKESDVNK